MAGSRWRSVRAVILRKKLFQPGELETGRLRRCLNRWDLTALGVGSTLGVGVYVLIGLVALQIAGPSVVLSFLIAAVAALLAGLCYGEFGSRVPRVGSAYIYSYVSVGELVAFIVGWNNILEAVFGAASLGRGLSMYVDTMTNGTMSEWFTEIAPISVTHMSPYFDLLAFLVVILIGTLLAVGVRESAFINNIFCVLNMLVIAFIVIAGAVTADVNNWYIPADQIPPNHGSGGFFPYGVWGTLKGAAVCFYGFVGFDSISAASEEVHNPRRAVPFTILTVLLVALVAYSSVAIVITMMMPYYLQEKVSTIATAFTYVGWEWAKWVVLVGAVFGILTCLYGALIPLPRLLYAMAADGLLFHPLTWISSSRKSPVVATLIPTIIIAVLAGILELEQLILMMCFGTLFSYTVVAASVIILRHRSEYECRLSASIFKQLIGCGDKIPTKATARIVDMTLILFMCICLILALVGIQVSNPTIPTAVLHALALLLLIIMQVQPKNKEVVSFKTPLVPIIPCLSIYVNIHLMILINVQTWIRVTIWTIIGIIIYVVCVGCCKRKAIIKENSNSYDYQNGKAPAVQIIVESPTPPTTITLSNYGDNLKLTEVQEEMKEIVREEPIKIEEIIIHQAYVENNEEKEAKIIDLLDQVLQAEEDSYGEIVSLKDKDEDNVSTVHETVAHRKSLSEQSDAGSDASLGNQVLSKYDVIAEVHREDMPKVDEEEERNERNSEEKIDREEDLEEHEQITAFNDDDSDTYSRTDESGYSDTIDKTGLSEAVEDKDELPNIPVPPPLDESYFAPKVHIPIKFNTIVTKHTTSKEEDDNDEHNKPRESVTSNGSQADGNITFGSDRQIHFMSKLNNIFQNKITSSPEEEPRRRSHSTGNVAQNNEFSVDRTRPPIFLDLKKELMSREGQSLRPINVEEKTGEKVEEEPKDISMSKEDIKSKLENIFAAGGPQLMKPRLMKSNPPTPEEFYQMDTSSTESIAKLPKIEKNDTLNRQKAKFGEVLNSFRLSFNKDDEV